VLFSEIHGAFINKKDQLELYHEMVLIRRLEERGAELYQQGKIGGFMHLYIGQEAVCTGLIAAREPNDRVITAYRDHGVAISCGISANEVMAELLGRPRGVKGQGARCTWRIQARTGGHAIVGASPIAMG
jgi:pyruvate dehydrogenase E1 component alpha subunit